VTGYVQRHGPRLRDKSHNFAHIVQGYGTRLAHLPKRFCVFRLRLPRPVAETHVVAWGRLGLPAADAQGQCGDHDPTHHEVPHLPLHSQRRKKLGCRSLSATLLCHWRQKRIRIQFYVVVDWSQAIGSGGCVCKARCSRGNARGWLPSPNSAPSQIRNNNDFCLITPSFAPDLEERLLVAVHCLVTFASAALLPSFCLLPPLVPCRGGSPPSSKRKWAVSKASPLRS
jgi:hypothetical protein